jgi:galactarate dehydratase
LRSPGGSVGTKNVLAISTSVQCVAGQVDVHSMHLKADTRVVRSSS